MWFPLAMHKESTEDRGDCGLHDSWGALQVDSERRADGGRSLQQRECAG